MPEPFETQLQELRHLLRHLPNIIPLPDPGNQLYSFDKYIPDEDWIERTGSEQGALNHALEVAFKNRAVVGDHRIIQFCERGPSLEGVVDVLRRYRIPGEDILPKWVRDLIASASAVYSTAKIVCNLHYFV